MFMKNFNKVTAGVLAFAMCFTSQAVFAERQDNNNTVVTAVSETKYPSVSLPDNAVEKIDADIKTVRSNTDTGKDDNVIVAESIDELPAEVAENNFYTEDYFKENVVICYDMTYYYYYLLHTPTNIFINTDNKIEIQLTDFIDMSNPRTTALTPPSRWYIVAGISRENYGNRQVVKSMQTIVLDNEETSAPVTTLDTKDTTTTTTTAEEIQTSTDTSTEKVKPIPFNNCVVLPSNYNDEEYRKNRSYQSAEELPDDLKNFFADTDFSKEEVIVVPYVGLYYEETLKGIGASDKEMYVDLECDWQGEYSLPAMAYFRKVAFSVDKKYNLSSFEDANIHIESVNKKETTTVTTEDIPQITTTRVSETTNTEETFEIEFGKSAVISDILYKDIAEDTYKIYAYHTAEELPEGLTELFGDTDFDKEKVIAVQIGGKCYDETLKAVSVQGKTLKLELECDWGDNDFIPELYVRKLAVFTIPNDNNIKNQMVEDCEKISVNSKDIIHTTTTEVTTSESLDTGSTTEATTSEPFNPDFTTETTTSEPLNTDKADLTNDGKVDVRDLMVAAQFIVGTKDGDYDFDVNGDGKSNILDLMIIAKSIVE